MGLISRFDCLAKGNSNGYVDLSCNPKFPEGRSVWADQPVETVAVSVASVIAERQGRLSKREFRQFLGLARGSLIEMETQIVIAGNLGVLNSAAVAALMDRSGEVSRLLHGLIKSLQPA